MTATRTIYYLNAYSGKIKGKENYMYYSDLKFSDYELEKMNNIIYSKIVESLKLETIKTEEIYLLINNWREFEDINNIKNEINKICEDDEKLIYILKGMQNRNSMETSEFYEELELIYNEDINDRIEKIKKENAELYENNNDIINLFEHEFTKRNQTE